MQNRRWVYWLPKPIRSKLNGRANLQAILANSSWLFFDKTIRMLLSLLVGAWVARYLGPTQYGELAYALAYIALFQAITSLGVDSIVVRDLSQTTAHASAILGTTLTLKITAGIACWILAICCMAAMNGWGDQSVVVVALVGGSLIFQAADTIDLWFQSQSQSRQTVIAKLSAYILSNGIKVILIQNQAPLIAFAAVLTLEALMSAIGLGLVYKKYPCPEKWQAIKSQGKRLLEESWPFMLSSISIIVYMRIDQIMIKEMLGVEALGVYAAILPLALTSNFIPMLLNTSLMPTISRLASGNQFIYEKALILIFRLYFFVALLIAFLTYLLSEKIVLLLYGPQFSAGAGILKIYIFSICFTWLGVAHTLWLVNEKKNKVRLYGTLLSSFVCISANYLFLKKFGVASAAWIAILTQFIAAFGVNALAARKSFLMQINAIFFTKIKEKNDNFI